MLCAGYTGSVDIHMYGIGGGCRNSKCCKESTASFYCTDVVTIGHHVAVSNNLMKLI